MTTDRRALKLWKEKYDEINNWDGFNDEILYEYRIPDKKGCEWVINTSPLRNKVDTHDTPVFLDIREKLMVEVRILGEENYLKKKLPFFSVRSTVTPADKKLKIKYLNTSPFDEVDFDYNNFIEWKGTENEGEWSMILDEYGDAYFL